MRGDHRAEPIAGMPLDEPQAWPRCGQVSTQVIRTFKLVVRYREKGLLLALASAAPASVYDVVTSGAVGRGHRRRASHFNVVVTFWVGDVGKEAHVDVVWLFTEDAPPHLGVSDPP